MIVHINMCAWCALIRNKNDNLSIYSQVVRIHCACSCFCNYYHFVVSLQIFELHVVQLKIWACTRLCACRRGWDTRLQFPYNRLPHVMHLLFQCSDTAYTNFHLDSHTDGNYFSEAPGTCIITEAGLLF